MHIHQFIMGQRGVVVKLMGFCIALGLVGTSLATDAQAAITRYKLNIPREPLDRALKEFARQTGLQVARFADVSGGDAVVGPVSGNLTSDEALEALLTRSDLTYRVLNHRTIAVVSRVSSGGSLPAEPQAARQDSPPTEAAGEVTDKDDGKAGRSFWDRFRLAQVDQGTSAGAASVGKEDPQDSTRKPAPLEEVVVTGIRFSLKESLATKRAAVDSVEVVTAEDIGKLPDKNVADVLQRVPGVNTQSAAAGAGGFDENNRVSIRGTGASLTQTTINGHSVATGDWFALDQYQTVGRSVSFDLLPSEMVQRTVVHKTQSADLIEGGVAGSVDLQTPKPLEFKETFTTSALLGGVYSDLPAKTQPQANALFNWQNGQMGVLAIGFYEKRDSRRDGQETLGYNTVSPQVASAWRAANPALPDASNALYPSLIGETLFNQTRKRAGGLIDFEVKPTDALTLDLNAFYSRLDADNTNANFLFFGSHIVSAAYVPTALTIAPNGTIVSGTWPTIPGQPIADTGRPIPYNTAVYDQVVRPSNSATYYVDLDASLVATDRVKLDAQVGFTRGVGNTDQESYVETQGGNGGSYNLHGVTNPVSVSYPGLNPADPNQFFVGFAFGNISHAIDKETYGQLNALFKIDSGLFESIKVGARFSSHTRNSFFPEKNGCNAGFCDPDSPLPAYNGGTYPGNYANALGGSGYPTNIYTYSPGDILEFDANALSHGPGRFYWPGEFRVKENDTALYAMTNFGGEGWSGNFGVRLVNTAEQSIVNLSGGQDPITTSLFGPYTPTLIKNNYFDILPTVNLKFDLAKDLVLRASSGRSMARPDYSALGGSVSLTDLNDTGNGGNPHLRPVRSANYDTSLEWYYAPQSLLEVGFFYMDMSSYIDFGTSTATYFNQQFGQPRPYAISSPFNTTAQVKGAELAWTQPLPLGFGLQANFTYADGKTGQGGPMVGNSRITYNVGGYYEAYGVSAHLDYTFRSHYLVGLDRSSAENEDDIGSLDAALNYTFNDNIGLSLNILNITNQTIKYYANDTSQPRAFYSNGRQYYFGVRLKL